VLLYLEGCPFCNACARMVRRVDRSDRLAYVSLRDPLAEELLPGSTVEERAAHWHLIQPDGTDLIGGAAVLALLEALPPTRLIGRAVRSLRMEKLLTAIDGFIGRKRSRLGDFVKDRPGPIRYP